jgi:hypothetical protein
MAIHRHPHLDDDENAPRRGAASMSDFLTHYNAPSITPQQLIDFGNSWNAHVRLTPTPGAQVEIIKHLNAFLEILGLQIKRGWQVYDPVVVRPGAKPRTYKDLAAWASQRNDGGFGAAKLFLDWCTQPTLIQLRDLPPELQELAVITHFAEVGRGYGKQIIQTQLIPWMQAIVAAGPAGAAAIWNDYNARYAPSLTYKVDVVQDWTG